MQYLVEKFSELRETGKTNIAVREADLGASLLTGSAFNKGGEFGYTPTFSNLRLSNPLRYGTRSEIYPSSAVRWVPKIGDLTSNAGPNGPWGYPQQINLGNTDTAFWSLPMQSVNAILPIRSWLFSDLPQFSAALYLDIERELFQREGQSAAVNNDATPTPGTSQNVTGSSSINTGPNGIGFTWVLTVATGTNFTIGQGATVAGITNPTTLNGTYQVIATTGTTVTLYYPNNPGNYSSGTATVTPAGTTPTGASSGLRGLDSYLDGTTWAWGTAGEGNGRHTLATVTQASATAITYNELTTIQNTLPPQFWGHPTTVWQVSPTKLNELRQIKDANGLPVLLDVGEDAEGGQTNLLFGRPVVLNPYLSIKYPLYLTCADYGLSFVDYGEIELQMFDQYIPGTTSIWAQKRVAFSVRDPSAVCRVKTS